MLKQLLAFMLVMSFACTSLAKPPVKHPITPATMELYKSITRVHLSAGKYSLTATAFAINQRFLLTAGHVCSGIQDLAVGERIPANIKGDYIDKDDSVAIFTGMEIVKIDPVNDLCLLFAPFHPLKPIPLETNPMNVKRFDRVYMAGSPLGEFPMVETCFVSSRDSEEQKDFDSRGWMALTCHAQPGNSGGPIIRNGKVVSVVSRGKSMLWPISPAFVTFGSTTTSILEFVGPYR